MRVLLGVVDEFERQIVNGLRARDLEAFDKLYARYRDAIWAFLNRLCRHRSEAEELFQDVWVSAAQHAHRLEENSDLRAWLYTIARNKHKNARRFLLFDLRRKQSFAQELQPTSETPDIALERSRALSRVRAAFEILSLAHREVLLLSVVEGLDSASVALVLGIKEDAVRKRLSRARAELADVLGRSERPQLSALRKEPVT